MARSRNTIWLLAMCSAVPFFAPAAFAQSSVVRSGSVEIGPFVGFSDGLDSWHVLAGGNITYAFKNRYVLPYFEYSYLPGLPASTSLNGQTLNYRVTLADFHGGVHVRIPIHDKPLVPYLVFGVGGLHSFATTASYQPPCTSVGCPPAQHPDQAAATSFAVNGGGGLRYYIGGSGAFGLRLEAKVYKATSGPFSGNTIGKVELGFFFQVH